MALTERQKNEIAYHRKHARDNAAILTKPFSWDVLDRPSRRWWNAYWQMYAYLSSLDLRGKTVLVVGCGCGDDALRLAKLGANVYAFDLSPDSLAIAKSLADREGFKISFEEMPAEALKYGSDFFDFIIARDILHHVDIPRAMSEIQRVAKSGALFVVNEIYSHSITNRVRHSVLVEKFLYRRMQRFIYGAGKPYITQDERKLNELDIQAITKPLPTLEFKDYFNFLVTRIVPDRYDALAKVDRILLTALKPIGHLLAGRVLFAGRIFK
jgi:ubiquinone/menaquinone biosynthesis C-methylase UbiE